MIARTTSVSDIQNGVFVTTDGQGLVEFDYKEN
jgi:hypothetical protein